MRRHGFETREPQGSFFYHGSLAVPRVRKHSAGDQHRLRGARPFPFDRPEQFAPAGLFHSCGKRERGVAIGTLSPSSGRKVPSSAS